MSPPTLQAQPKASMIPLVVGNLVGLLGTIVVPVFIDGWGAPQPLGLGLSPELAGAVAGSEAIVLALAAVATTTAKRAPPPSSVAGFVFMLTLILMLSALVTSPLFLFFLRCTSAALAGIVFAICARSLALFENPGRTAALVTLAVALVGAGAVYLLEMLRLKCGLAGTTIAYSAMMMAFGGVLRFRPPADVVEQPIGAMNVIGRRSAFLLLALATCVVADQGMYAFAHHFALRADVGADSFATILGISSALAPLGALAAFALGRHTSLVSLAAAAMALKAAAIIVTGSAASAPVLLASMSISSSALYFASPVLMGAAAVIDRSGQLVSCAGAVILASTGLGPFAAGTLLAVYGEGLEARVGSPLALNAASLTAFAAVCICWIGKTRMDRDPPVREGGGS